MVTDTPGQAHSFSLPASQSPPDPAPPLYLTHLLEPALNGYLSYNNRHVKKDTGVARNNGVKAEALADTWHDAIGPRGRRAPLLPS